MDFAVQSVQKSWAHHESINENECYNLPYEVKVDGTWNHQNLNTYL